MKTTFKYVVNLKQEMCKQDKDFLEKGKGFELN